MTEYIKKLHSYAIDHLPSHQERVDDGSGKFIGWCVAPRIITLEGVPTRIACRNCGPCLAAAKQARAGQMIAEGYTSASTWFVTLTYAPGENGASAFYHHHIKKLVATMRYKLAKEGIGFRFAIAGEKGNLHGRVHWHGVFYFDKPYRPPFIKAGEKWDMWPYGWSRLEYIYGDGSSGELTRRVRYVVKYALKSDPASLKDGEAIDNGERPFFYSRRPPLGSEYYIADAIVRAKHGELYDGFVRFGGIVSAGTRRLETFPLLSQRLLLDCIDAWCENYSGDLGKVPGDAFVYPYVNGSKGEQSWLDLTGADTMRIGVDITPSNP